LFILLQRKIGHHRIEIDRLSAAAEGIVTVKVDMLPSDRRDFFEKSQCFGAFGRLILVEQPRKDGGVVINDRIRDQPTALIADLDVDICFTAQLFLAPYLGSRRSELVIGLDAVLRTVDVTLQLSIA
jgi:hypothetical protein